MARRHVHTRRRELSIALSRRHEAVLICTQFIANELTYWLPVSFRFPFRRPGTCAHQSL